MPSLALQPGQLISKDDLNFFSRDRQGNMSDPFQLTYAIFEEPGDILITAPDLVPERVTTGYYFASWKVPDTIGIGPYVIRWFVRDTENSPLITIAEQFEVVGLQYQTQAQPFPDYLSNLIFLLRISLRDNNPDRNYHFAPPSLEKEVSGYSRVFGFIWEDYELAAYLELAMSDINVYPPGTVFTLNRFPQQYLGTLITGAGAKAAAALMANWTVDDFGYSIGGKDLSLDKASKYEALKSNLEEQFRATIEAVKPKGPGSALIKGLQQSFYGISARASLGPFTGRFVLTARNYARLGSMK